MGFRYHGNATLIAARDDSKEAQIAGCLSESNLAGLGRPVGGARFFQPLSQDLLGNPDEQMEEDKKGLLSGRGTLVMVKMERETQCCFFGTFLSWTCRDGFYNGEWEQKQRSQEPSAIYIPLILGPQTQPFETTVSPGETPLVSLGCVSPAHVQTAASDPCLVSSLPSDSWVSDSPGARHGKPSSKWLKQKRVFVGLWN